eukprot:TRINITY_DN56878_c0_g1_i1.p1 TRINITY_DN56878_c0_g1~~TRINITY_DN56878_c0_g1_i1.p1  ORF type:complete len:393 (-),score=50.30 TRINITY_DN56878_c0_g1_i1:26-1204(-)
MQNGSSMTCDTAPECLHGLVPLTNSRTFAPVQPPVRASRGGAWRRHDLFCRWLLLLVICGGLFRVGRSQVRNLRFDDTDSDADAIGGLVSWEQPVGGSGGDAYAVFLSQDDSGTGETQIGSDVSHRMWPPELIIPSSTSSSGFTHIIVYLRGSGGLHSAASICLMDSPSKFQRTVYLTLLGRANADGATQALVAGCHANIHRIVIEMVATVTWTGSDIVETDFDDLDDSSEASAFSVIFPSGSSLTYLETAIAAYTVGAPVPAVFAETGVSATHVLASVQVASIMDVFVTEKPDPDHGRYFAKSCIMYSLASSATINYRGEVRLQTLVDCQGGLQEMLDVYQTGHTVTFQNLGAEASTLTAITSRATETQASCLQITATPGHVSCTNGLPFF